MIICIDFSLGLEQPFWNVCMLQTLSCVRFMDSFTSYWSQVWNLHTRALIEQLGSRATVNIDGGTACSCWASELGSGEKKSNLEDYFCQWCYQVSYISYIDCYVMKIHGIHMEFTFVYSRFCPLLLGPRLAGTWRAGCGEQLLRVTPASLRKYGMQSTS